MILARADSQYYSVKTENMEQSSVYHNSK